MNKRLIPAIARAGLLAGALDILAACGNYSIRTGGDPIIVLKFVASGALGPDALKGGWMIALLGLFFHFVIAFSWTTLFFLIYPKVPKGSWIGYGLGYGIVVWLLMNLIVIPMSRIQPRPFDLNSAMVGAAILMVMIGLPISYHARKYYSR